MMGIAVAILMVCAIGVFIAYLNDAWAVLGVFAGIGIFAIAIICTLVNIQKTCDDYGKFSVGNRFYQCELIQGKK